MPVHDPSSESFDWEAIFESSDRCGTQALRGHLSGQTLVDNVMNDLESVNFIQSKNAGA
ncbi:TPA: hypothetical protein MDS86_002660 [Klebsiella pneumoniae]|uniref:hypothetical protein n=1 Tax=Klebsiella pneumoniae TaxID=573 RepID=UPI000AAB1107|nr:hypothetical protein [Klebsiella pneumoniae]MCA5541885.1 hypothetical protein [Klebsiella pneumoniae]WFY67781.1 hypothetical protein NFK38_12725 [Klebsiella pneumoniae]HBV2696627.1 hypothetical protein [Klebsiella pneumoniae]HBW8767883.1 hypothetical protein [Klebsiella pneumoniae]HBW8935833.1 hypothetical protein [Klebsiella pneumoniae]